MATKVSIDSGLLKKALAVSGERTKKAVVTLALREFIARRESRRLVALFGKFVWDPAYDFKAERSRELPRGNTTSR